MLVIATHRGQAAAMKNGDRAERGDDEIARRFGEWLEAMLRVRNWTRADLGRRIGSHGSLVSKWAHGYQRPDSLSCRQIAEAFGVPVREVMILAGHADPDGVLAPDPAKAQLHHRVDELPEWLVGPVLALLDGLLDPSKERVP